MAKYLLWASLLLSFSVSTHADLSKAERKSNGNYIRSYFLQLMKKPFVESKKRKALIIGDSHAQDFLNSVHENGYLSQYQISTRYIPTRCQIYLGSNYDKFVAPADRLLCEKSDSLLLAREQIAQADLVILSSKWRDWSAKALPQTIKNLKLLANQKLLVIGTKSFGRYDPKKYSNLSKEALRQIRAPIDENQIHINSAMASSLSTDIFVNLHKIVCGDTESCPVFTGTLKPISVDGGHLTKDGARFVGKKLFNSKLLAQLKH